MAVGAILATLPASFSIIPQLPRPLELAILLLGGMWFVNLVNFMDGIDWMTVAEVVPIAAGVALLGLIGAAPAPAVLVALALLGGMIGFAPFNRPVARLFLGDVGSLPIGLMLGWVLLMLAGRGHLAAALLLPLYYLADASITLGRRLIEARARLAGPSHAFLSARHRTRLLGQRSGRAGLRAQSRARGARAGERDRAGHARRSRRARARRRDGGLAARHVRAGQAMTRVLVTGASGFIGRPLCARSRLPAMRYAPRYATAARRLSRRHRNRAAAGSGRPDRLGSVARRHRRSGASRGIAHAGREVPDAAYEQVNHLATAAFARAAAAAGVRRFVFVSSIGAQSAATADHPLTEDETARPAKVYGQAKLAAENAVRASGVRYTILRPMLVYGPDPKGNIARLKWLADLPCRCHSPRSGRRARCSRSTI